jgi:hypothetical protein
MTNDHPLKHPENARAFLTYVGAFAVGAFGVLWLYDGAQLSRLPGFAIIIAFFMAMFAWGPIFKQIVGRLPVQTWSEIPAAKRWSEFLFNGAFAVTFLIWSAAMAAIAFAVLDEVAP